MSSKDHPCQLCGIKSKAGIEIFGQKGVQLSIKSILFQHFSLEITEGEKGLKIICKKCWKITDAFHQLFCVVKDLISGLNHKKSSIQLSTTTKTECNNEHSNAQLDLIDTKVKLEAYDYSRYITDDNLGDDDSDNSSKPIQLLSELTTNEENYIQKVDAIDKDCSSKLEEKTERLTTKQLTVKQLQEIEEDKEIRNSLGIVCELCDKNCTTFLDLRRHLQKEHKVTGYIRCCEQQYKSRSLLYAHIQDHKNPARLQCSVCEKTFINHSNLNSHMKRHNPTLKKIQCPSCPKLFENKSNLKSHVERAHFTGPRSFICDVCGKSFVSKLTITTHLIAVHVRKYSQICDTCGKAYQTVKQLDLHSKTNHLGIQLPKVQCSICGAWLLNKDSLRKHVRHHYAKEETCPICGKISPNRHAMRNHIRKVHSGQIYPCTMCDKKFKKQKSLSEHISTHTGYNLYRCTYCDKEFTYESCLYKHRKDVHSIEVEEDRSRKMCNPIKKANTY